jgi:hypothetical protein
VNCRRRVVRCASRYSARVSTTSRCTRYAVHRGYRYLSRVFLSFLSSLYSGCLD